IALLVGARAARMETGQGVLTVIALPMVLFSGVFFSSSGFPFSTSGMPAWIQHAARILPLTAFNDALRADMNEGARPPLESVALLAGWGAVLSAIALRTFKWT